MACKKPPIPLARQTLQKTHSSRQFGGKDFQRNQSCQPKIKDKLETLPPYVANLSRGPILLTAPHSTKVKRGGSLVNQKERTHLREHWASTIVLLLAQAIEEMEGKVIPTDKSQIVIPKIKNPRLFQSIESLVSTSTETEESKTGGQQKRLKLKA